MKTITQLRKDMSAFDSFARTHLDSDDLQEKWKHIFDSTLSKESADAFVAYYRKMKRNTQKTKKMKGGMVGAPLTYTMTPGANVSVYGQFPVAVDNDAASIRDLDVFFQSALTRDCGNPAQAAAFPHPTTEMGTNQVGGRRRKSRRSNARKTQRKNRKNMNRRGSRRQRGGSLMTTLGYHPFLATAPPNIIQSAANAASGGVNPIPFPGAPTVHNWNYVSNGTVGVIDPGLVTPIGTSFSKLAGQDPWQTQS